MLCDGVAIVKKKKCLPIPPLLLLLGTIINLVRQGVSCFLKVMLHCIDSVYSSFSVVCCKSSNAGVFTYRCPSSERWLPASAGPVTPPPWLATALLRTCCNGVRDIHQTVGGDELNVRERLVSPCVR